VEKVLERLGVLFKPPFPSLIENDPQISSKVAPFPSLPLDVSSGIASLQIQYYF